jgi:predicted ATPase/signal transduction histidine kinase
MSQTARYVEHREIHTGRRYVVLRAREPGGATRVLKVVRPGPRAADSAARLRHEHEVLASLAVPGVVRSFGLADVEGAPALVLEDAGPHDLRAWLRRRPLGLGAFLACAVQLADTLAGLHEARIIHREINAANVVAGDEGQLTLVDFGLATSVAGGQAGAGEQEGALEAMAPEQTGRLGRPVDHRADLYAIGALFYEMLTGAPPFSSPDPAELVHAHLARPPVPPVARNPETPPIVSDLVLRLLAKMPEQRYQSAAALAADLREIRRRIRAGAPTVGLELGRVDLEREIATPARLHGRGPELARVTAGFERAAAGAGELCLVSGRAGVGKSALVHEVLAAAAHCGARILRAKFDELRGQVPYAPIVEAARDLLRGLQREPSAVGACRARIRGAVGPSLGGLLALLPELAELLGEAAPEQGAEADPRFCFAFSLLLHAVAAPEAPLVIFLDDLQWADAASLHLLTAILGPDARHLWVVGAYRSEDVTPDHPLARVIAAVRGAAVPLTEVALAPLGLPDLAALCAAALRCPLARALPLAAVVQRKTAGNPLFAIGFLRHLHRAGLLVLDAESGAWDWDERRVEEAGVTDNVVALLVATIQRLPEETQGALRIAACLPGRVDLDLLAAVSGTRVDETARALWSALHEGLLVPDAASDRGCRPPGGPGSGAVYRFVHDRVQEAAYSMLPADTQRRVHLAAGWRLLEGGEDDRLFDAAEQIHRGADLLEGEAERLRAAEVDLRAARRATAASAFAQALSYASRGLALLPPAACRSHHALWFALSRDAAESAYLTGDLAGAQARIAAALPCAASVAEEQDLLCLRIVAGAVAQDHRRAIQCGREALARFGFPLPEEADAGALADAERAALEAEIARRGDDLEAAPAATDPRVLACLALLSKLTASAHRIMQRGLFRFVVTRMVDLSLRHGMAPESGGAFVRFGILVGEAHADFAAGHAVSRRGLALARRLGDARQGCRATFAFAVHMSHWRDPLRAADALYRRAAAEGLAAGELQYAAFARESAVRLLFVMGVPLDQVVLDLEDATRFARRIDCQDAIQSLAVLRQVVRCLEGRTRGPSSLDDGDFDEAAFLDAVREAQPSMQGRVMIFALQLRYLAGDWTGARVMSDGAALHAEQALGAIEIAEHDFYTSLTLAALAGGCAADERADLLAAIDEHQRRLGRWAEGCPENYRHRHRLVAAEVARVEGRPLDEALELYDQAIEGARAQGCLHDEALARELAGRCLRARGRRSLAGFHLQGAIRAYARWGATAKVEALEDEFGALLAAPDLAPPAGEAGGADLDVMSLFKAAETLSSEVVLDRLLEKLMAVSLELCGARRGALILEVDGARVVCATGAVPAQAVVESAPLDERSEVPRSLVDEVFAQGEPVVLADAARRGRFTADPYVAGHAVKSALGLPLRRHGRTVGVLYLENDLATRAFTRDRVRVLELLSPGFAVALDNGALFQKLTREIAERARAEQGIRFLAEESALLAESLDYEATLARVARLAVPFFAAWCVVDVLGPDGTLQRVAAAHIDPEKEPLLRELRERYPPAPGSPIPPEVAVRTGAPYLVADVDDAFHHAVARDERHVDLVRGLGIHSLMSVPLVAGDRKLGAMTFCSAVPGRRYDQADLTLAQEIAHRAALAIENASLYRQAQEAIRLRDEFVRVASHELNTPVAALQLAAQALTRGKAPPSPERLRHALALIERQGERLAALVSEMLDASRLGADRIDLHLEPVDLAGVVRESIERLSPQIARAACPLSLRAPAPVVGLWDKDRLVQVATILLTNAFKFGKGSPIEVAVEERLGAGRLVVADHGIGIEAARLGRVFDRFERGVSADHYGGLGLGLYIAREIVTAFGGAIHAESEAGAGSTFTVELPCAGPARAAA